MTSFLADTNYRLSCSRKKIITKLGFDFLFPNFARKLEVKTLATY